MSSLVSAIEHTRLKADTTPQDVEQLCAEALQFGFAGVCVNPVYVPQVKRALTGSAVKVVTVVGFPLGASSEPADCAEAAWVIEQGADEVDMVIPIGLALSGDLGAVTQRVTALRRATSRAVLKVIIECGFFEEAQLRDVCLAAAAGSPDYLKTATGFGPRGASIEDVRLLAEVARQTNGAMAVKASGGIRSAQDAVALTEAGATRLGTSSGVVIAQALG